MTDPNRKSTRLRKQPRRRKQRPDVSSPALTTAKAGDLLPPMPQSVNDRKWRTRTEPIRVTATTIRSSIFSSRMVSLLLLILCVAILSISWFQPGLYLRQFDIQGLGYVDASDVIMASGLEGMHIFSAHRKNAVKAVQQVPGVVSANVAIAWPNRTIITVEEETPVAIWEQEGQSFWLNSSGHLVELRDSSLDLVKIIVDTAGGNNMPLIIPDELDGRVNPLRQETRMIPTTIMDSALQLASLNPDFDHLFYSSSHGLTYQHEDGWFAYFGSSGDMMIKASIYQSLLNQLATDGTPIYYIDLSDEEMVYYQPINAEEDTKSTSNIPNTVNRQSDNISTSLPLTVTTPSIVDNTGEIEPSLPITASNRAVDSLDTQLIGESAPTASPKRTSEEIDG